MTKRSSKKTPRKSKRPASASTEPPASKDIIAPEKLFIEEVLAAAMTEDISDASRHPAEESADLDFPLGTVKDDRLKRLYLYMVRHKELCGKLDAEMQAIRKGLASSEKEKQKKFDRLGELETQKIKAYQHMLAAQTAIALEIFRLRPMVTGQPEIRIRKKWQAVVVPFASVAMGELSEDPDDPPDLASMIPVGNG
jgi:hypothetical protein